MNIISLVLLQGLIFGIAGVAVRVQYSLFRGFDFMVGGLVLIAAELFVVSAGVFPNSPEIGVIFALIVSMVGAGAAAFVWNALVLGVWPKPRNLSASLFVASLGMSTMVTGLVGLMRGAGLAQTPWELGEHSVVGVPMTTLAGLTVCGSMLFVILFGVRRTRAGLAIELYGQNPDFAGEIGVEPHGILLTASLQTGCACGAVGSYLALADGSRPELGLLVFLYGSAAALLFLVPTLFRAACGGMILGTVYVISQLLVSPGIAGLLLFSAVAIILLVRGSSRAVERVR